MRLTVYQSGYRNVIMVCMNFRTIPLCVLLFVLGFWPVIACADSGDPDHEGPAVSTEVAPEGDSGQDEEEERKGFLKKFPKNLLIEPIPTSSPTFGTGLILAGAWFYSQTEEQKETQPASYTGAAAAYTSNRSWAAGVMQQNYWNEDTWRFNGAAGYINLKLDLVTPEPGDQEESRIDWLVKGALVQGRFLELKVLNSNQSGDSDNTYQSYHARFRSYHLLSDSLVLAWEVNGCARGGQAPLWDTCRLGLRGFSATEYLGKKSVYSQAEIRWRLYKKLGLVGFAGTR